MSDDKPFVVVSVLDPAIDTVATSESDMLKYAQTRDLKLLKFKPGTRPTRYHLREVLHSVWESHVRSADSLSEQYRRAFMCGLLKVDNLVQRDGGILPEYTPAGLPKEPCMQEAEAERFPHRVREEIGMVAFTRSFFGWGIEPTYRVPHLCLRYLEETAYRPADATPPSPAPSNSEASPATDSSPAAHASTVPAPSSTGAGSGSPTDVTATVPTSAVA